MREEQKGQSTMVVDEWDMAIARREKNEQNKKKKKSRER